MERCVALLKIKVNFVAPRNICSNCRMNPSVTRFYVTVGKMNYFICCFESSVYLCLVNCILCPGLWETYAQKCLLYQ